MLKMQMRPAVNKDITIFLFDHFFQCGYFPSIPSD